MRSSPSVVEPHVLTLGQRQFSARQEEVLDVVERVLRREGIRGVRMGRLAAEASCSRSTLYGLATSKEDLLLLVLDRMMRRTMRRGAQAIDAADGPVDKLEAMMTSGALDFGDLGSRFLEAVRQYPPARLLFDRRVRQGLDVLRAFVDDAVQTGQFRSIDSALVAEAIFAIVTRFTDSDLVRTAGTNSRTDLNELIDVLLDGLRPRS